MILEKARHTMSNILQEALILSFVIFGIFIFIKPHLSQDFLKGALISCLNFLILYISIVKSINRGYTGAFVRVYISFLLRIALSFLVLYINLLKSTEGCVITLLGLQVIKVVIYSNTILGRCKRWSSFQR